MVYRARLLGIVAPLEFQSHFGGISHASVTDHLDSANGRDIVFDLYSHGGSSCEASAIHTAISDYPGKVTFRIFGIAASAASYITTAADEVLVTDSSIYWMHLVHGTFRLNPSEMKAELPRFLELTRGFAAGYAKKSGKTVDTIMTDLESAPSYVGKDIIAQGFADGMFALAKSSKKDELLGDIKVEQPSLMMYDDMDRMITGVNTLLLKASATGTKSCGGLEGQSLASSNFKGDKMANENNEVKANNLAKQDEGNCPPILAKSNNNNSNNSNTNLRNHQFDVCQRALSYGAPVQKLALAHARNDSNMEAVEAVMAMEDQRNEGLMLAQAQAEQMGDTPPKAPNALGANQVSNFAQDGSVKNENDFNEARANMFRGAN